MNFGNLLEMGGAMELQLGVKEVTGELCLSPNAVVVLKRRYLKKDDKGEVAEGAPDMFRRVADTIAAMDRNYDPDADVAATVVDEAADLITAALAEGLALGRR